jgi:hypothetical protein
MLERPGRQRTRNIRDDAQEHHEKEAKSAHHEHSNIARQEILVEAMGLPSRVSRCGANDAA